MFYDFLEEIKPIGNKKNILLMDNARIHHDDELIAFLEGLGCHVAFLPPYSPDYNSIETAFSTIKSWIRHNRDFMKACNDPIYALLVACSQITPQLAQTFFKSSIYL